MSRYLELAERVEALTGPDREVDGLIDRLLNDRPSDGDYDTAENAIWQIDNGYSGLLVRSDGFARGSFCAAKFTASLDAAMSLMPDGWTWTLGVHAEGWEASAYRGLKDCVHVCAETPALALCAAALRSRHSLSSDSGERE